MSKINLNKLSEEEILELIKDELSEDELMDAEDYKLCHETISVNFNKCSCSNLDCPDCLFGKEKRSYVLEKLNINQEELDLSDYSDDDIVEKLKTIYKYDDLGDLKNEPDSLCQIKGNPFYACYCSEISCSDCILDISNRFDLIKLLKDSKPKEIMEDKPSDAIELMVIRRVHHGLDSTINVDWPIGHRTWANSSYKEEFIKDGTIHPENNRHRMNVPATCFAPINPSDFEGPFKVGDWVIITKSNKNWASSMNKFVGKKVQITDVWNNGWGIRFKEDSTSFSWNYYQGHFIPCRSQMHTTMHSKSGAPKENRKYSIKEIETDPKLLIYLDSEIDYIKITAHLKYNNLPYNQKRCHNFNRQLYCILSDLNNVGSFPEDSIILVYEDIDLNIEEEEREGGGVLIKSNSRASSISNILKRIKI